MAERGGGDQAWLKRHEWWRAACAWLFEGGDAAAVNPKPPDHLDGRV